MTKKIKKVPAETNTVIDSIITAQALGEIEGLVVGMKMKDNTFFALWNGSLSYLERIGIIENVKLDMYAKANEPHEEDDNEDNDNEG